MSVTITINGELKLDQTAGLQDDDVALDVVAGSLTGGLDSQFLAFLNALGLSDDQKAFAANVEGASEPNLVSVTADAGETVGKLFFSDSTGNDLEGVLVPDVTTLDGAPLYLWSTSNGKVVLVSTSNVAPTADTLVAAFYIEANDALNSSAKVESITFAPLLHPNDADPDDTIDFSDVLQVSAVISTAVGDDIQVDDDGPTIVTSGTEPTLTVDETVLATDDTKNFSTAFTPDFGTDGAGAAGVTYELNAVAGPSGLIATIANEAVILSKNGDTIEGRTETSDELVFVVSVDADGNVTLDQNLAVRHDPNVNANDETTLASDDLVTLTATAHDADNDTAATTLDIGHNLVFVDDAPSVETTGDNPTITVDETNLGFATGDFAPNFSTVFGNDGDGGTTFSLGVTAGLIAGVTDTNSGEGVDLQAVDATHLEGRTAIGGLLVFSISVDASGVVTFTQARSITHADDADPDDPRTLGSADLVTLTATVTDGDGDQDSATLNIGDVFTIDDDGPTVTVPSSAGTLATAAHLPNEADGTVSGDFGYDIGADDHGALFYAAGGSDFVDTNAALAGVQISLTGTVNGPPATAITDTEVTLQSEDADSALFDFSFTYDKDPITAGVQAGTATGSLLIDKDDDTFTLTLDDPIEGFSFSVLHTNELLAKAPPGNTGHPEIVVTELDTDTAGPPSDGFYVQFTANTTTQQIGFGFDDDGDGAVTGGTSFNAGEMITNLHEDWVSATQSTNGVAGDTIQKGELLTLRFFGENILGDVNPNAPGGGTEKTAPTTTADGVAIKFDGIGNNEDLVVVLDLVDKMGTVDTADDVYTTRAINVQNSDLIKGVVPAPYNTEFSLDNNDALLVMESNDYNAAGEHYEIQGIQIMQSANGLTGTAINLNGAVGEAGGSSTTVGLQAWDVTDNDVLKIVDIGFIQTTTGVQTADLDFSFDVTDGDFDPLGTQHIFANISNEWII